MARPPQQAPRQSRLAIHNRQRPRQAEETVPSVRVTRATRLRRTMPGSIFRWPAASIASIARYASRTVALANFVKACAPSRLAFALSDFVVELVDQTGND